MINGEIVSADSMLVYRGMDIGTAKPNMAERDGVPHHLIDVVSPMEDFSAANFQQMAREAIDDIHNRGKLPILAGGTGFYINAAVYGGLLADCSKKEAAIRKLLMQQTAMEGGVVLHNRLKVADPLSAEKIHPNNIKRVVRALAHYEATGYPISANNQEQKLLYNTLFIVLNRNRDQLYEAIDRRVEMMMIKGLEDEVKKLIAYGINMTTTAMQALGYKEMIPYFSGQCTLEEAKQAIKQGSRRYAKRQLTWFRQQIKNGVWLSMDNTTPKQAADMIKKMPNIPI